MSIKASDIIYLDNNATTQIDPRVLDTMLPWLQDHYGNASSIYGLGRQSAQAIDGARLRVADLIGATPAEVIFTSCGTESINTAIQSACNLDPDKYHIITSAVEHSATVKLCDHLAQRGYEITRLAVDKDGQISLDELRSSIRSDTAIVSLLWANNETGTLFPVEKIAAICQEKGVLLHLDAVQAVGKLPVNVSDLGVHLFSLSGHKLHCPKGIGALYVNKRIRFFPFLRGSQENSRRGGTENVASIVAFGKAAELAGYHIEEEGTRIRTLRDRFEQHLLDNLTGVTINGDRKHRLPNTSNLSFEGIEAEALLLLLDEVNIYCSAGSACASGSISPSHVLTAMGISSEQARSSVRFSFGRFNTTEQCDNAANEVCRIVKKLRSLY